MIKDMIINNTYDLFFFQIVSIYSIVGSICIQSFTIFKFLQWIIKRRNIILILYTISYLSLFITLLIILLIIYNTNIQSFELTPFMEPTGKTIHIDSLLKEFYRIFSLTTFMFLWIATSMLLKTYSTNYRKKIGKTTYWILVSLPLITYLLSSDYIMNNIYILLVTYNLNTIITYIISISKSIGGIFFALPFLFMAKNISNNNLKFYLLICGIGVMILISSLQLALFYKNPYPPFNFITVTNIFVSSYLLLIGFILSAKSISDDRHILSELKIQIKNTSFLFLKGIGSVEWQNNIEKIMKQIQKSSIVSNVPIESSMNKKEIEEFVIKILAELKDKNMDKEIGEDKKT